MGSRFGYVKILTLSCRACTAHPFGCMRLMSAAQLRRMIEFLPGSDHQAAASDAIAHISR